VPRQDRFTAETGRSIRGDDNDFHLAAIENTHAQWHDGRDSDGAYEPERLLKPINLAPSGTKVSLCSVLLRVARTIL
jgi:hypothetical protein